MSDATDTEHKIASSQHGPALCGKDIHEDDDTDHIVNLTRCNLRWWLVVDSTPPH